jgi:hypothetical protein
MSALVFSSISRTDTVKERIRELEAFSREFQTKIEKNKQLLKIYPMSSRHPELVFPIPPSRF